MAGNNCCILFHNWFYFFEGPDKDFDVDITDLNFKRKEICEKYILPNLKIDHDEIKNFKFNVEVNRSVGQNV